MTLSQEKTLADRQAAEAFLAAWVLYAEAKQFIFSNAAKFAELSAAADAKMAEGNEAADHARFLEWAENMEAAVAEGYY